MIVLKTTEEIELLRASNDLVGRTLGELAKIIQPGVTTKELDVIAEEFICDNGGIPTFKGYPNASSQGTAFPASICTSVNEVVIHGIPNDKPLQEGDIVSIDCGTSLNGYCGDSAYTFCVGEVEELTVELLRTTKRALYEAINIAMPGKRIGDIGYAVQTICEEKGYNVVREFVGHGIGKEMHEEPNVPNYGRRGTGMLMKNGLCIAIEPMIVAGKRDLYMANDGWTVSTLDRKPAAHYEHTIAIMKNGAEVLSTFRYIEEVLGERAI